VNSHNSLLMYLLHHPSFASGARGPFRCAQEDYFMGSVAFASINRVY